MLNARYSFAFGGDILSESTRGNAIATSVMVSLLWVMAGSVGIRYEHEYTYMYCFKATRRCYVYIHIYLSKFIYI